MAIALVGAPIEIDISSWLFSHSSITFFSWQGLTFLSSQTLFIQVV